MKIQFTNTTLSSFLFWAEHEVLNTAQGYFTTTSKLYPYTDERLGNGYVVYGSPYKQWVYDQGVSGANILNIVSGSVNLNRTSGMIVDYDNGRIILPVSYGLNLQLTGTYSFKELNTYISNETEEKLISENRSYLNSRFTGYNNREIPPYSFVNPALYFNLLNNNNKPFALGGLDSSNINLSIVVMTENMFQLDSVLGLFSDKQYTYFPLIAPNEDPLNEFGDIKTGVYISGYNYKTLKEERCIPGTTFYIESIRGSKLSDGIRANNTLFVGIIDAEVSMIRRPRS